MHYAEAILDGCYRPPGAGKQALFGGSGPEEVRAEIPEARVDDDRDNGRLRPRGAQPDAGPRPREYDMSQSPA